MKVLLIIITLLLIIGVIVLFIKFVLNPLFLVPKLSLNEVVNILEKKGCGYFSHNFIKSKNKFHIEDLFTNNSQYVVVGISVKDKSIRTFNVKIRTYNSFFRKREIIIKEVT
ncbi:hypothetical protein [Flavobacterium okayamense]|uniref:Uncharacterized protein n=1 Tax=Flavobacterium okayamense TaxID=2830782 RepID=A0ABN6HXD1_9FLAO|nr:hypothetical protein [Flavobacterium okayamense]BCY29074.1 hypothetical protein KK2020170_19420 [Flavobacterium okayamense]